MRIKLGFFAIILCLSACKEGVKTSGIVENNCDNNFYKVTIIDSTSICMPDYFIKVPLTYMIDKNDTIARRMLIYLNTNDSSVIIFNWLSKGQHDQKVLFYPFNNDSSVISMKFFIDTTDEKIIVTYLRDSVQYYNKSEGKYSTEIQWYFNDFKFNYPTLDILFFFTQKNVQTIEEKFQSASTILNSIKMGAHQNHIDPKQKFNLTTNYDFASWDSLISEPIYTKAKYYFKLNEIRRSKK
jgi:hypothetical protein